MRVLMLSGIVLAAVGPVWAQSGPRFEVATLRESGEAVPRSSGITDPSLYVRERIPLVVLIGTGYDVIPSRILGPDWIAFQLVSLNGKIPEGNHSRSDINAMVHALLEERYGLATHRESKTGTAVVLSVNKTGPNLTPLSPSDAESPVCKPASGAAGYVCSKVTMKELALILESWLKLPVIDQTGIEGAYELKAEIGRDDLLTLARRPIGDAPPSRYDAPSLFDMLDKLGLKLEPTRAPAEYLVIDKISKHPVEN
jgi:uncharacterized protein (TIGR03435 family)